MAPTVDVMSTEGWQAIEVHLPQDFEALAKEKKVLEVQYGEAKITSARDLLRLILLHAGADIGLRQTVVLAAEGDLPEVSHVTLHKKMRLASPFLRELVGRLTRGAGDPASPERWAGYEVAAVDGSSFCGPGADGTDARVHLQLRLSDLEILGVTIEDRSIGESFKRFVWKPGQLALGDRGYANPPGIASVVEQGANVLVRVNRSALPMRTPGGEAIDLMPWLRSLKGYAVGEQRVVIFSREHQREVEGRLIAVRLPAAQAENARARVRREFGGKTSSLDLEAAQYVMLFTTVPTSRMSAEMCLALYRLRWQVELAFKRWKSLCHFDRLPNYRDDTILSWLYAKLLLALLMHRMASGASSLFPPEPQIHDDLVRDALESREHPVARPRRRSHAA
jgi:hypothetical protein